MSRIEVVPTPRLAAKVKNNRAATNPKVAAAVEARKKGAPLVLKGIGPGKRTTLGPASHKRVDFDLRYQRGEIKPWVNEIVAALNAGGLVLDPITIVRRTWHEPGEDTSKLYWIIDGLQRFTALESLGRDIDAIVHESESLDAERAFFLVMNARRNVNTNKIVRAWPGEGAKMLSAINETAGHSLCGRIEFAYTGGDRIGAAVLVKATITASSGVLFNNDIQKGLTRLDHAMKDRQSRLYAETFLELVGRVFPKSYGKLMPMQVLAEVARKRWSDSGRVYIPTDHVIAKLSEINWDFEVPTFNMKYRPIIVAAVEKRWRSPHVAAAAK